MASAVSTAPCRASWPARRCRRCVRWRWMRMAVETRGDVSERPLSSLLRNERGIGLRQVRADGFAPGVKFLQQSCRLLRFLCREIVLLGRILAEVIELKAMVLEVLQQLPIPGANRTHGCGGGIVMRIVEIQGAAIQTGGWILQQGREVGAIDQIRRWRQARGVHTRVEKIGEDHGLGTFGS